MRRLVLFATVLALTLALVPGCDKEDKVTGPDGNGSTDVPIPDQLALSRAVPPLLANGTSTAEIYATVVDAKRRALPNVGVYFLADKGGIEPYATTNVNGVARSVYTSAASAVDLTARITAQAFKDTVGASAPGALVILSKEPLSDELLQKAIDARLGERADGIMAAAQEVAEDRIDVRLLGITFSVSATPGTIPADGASTSRVRARLIQTTTLVPLEGETVRFGSSVGAITGSVRTDATGTATAVLTSTTTGSADITAYYGSTLTATTAVSFSPLSLTLEAGAAQIQENGSHQTVMTARIVNAEKNPVEGVDVTFSTTQGTIASPVATDKNGEAVAVLTTPVGVTSAEVTARFGTLSQSRTVSIGLITFTLAAARSSIVADGRSTTDVTARLLNLARNPVEGVRVSFTTTAGTVTGSAVTDAAGEAKAVLRSAATVGSATVSAVYGTATPVTTVVQFTAAPQAAEVLLSATPGSLPADGASQAVLRARVLDSTGNPVPDGTAVTFSVVSGGGSIVAPARTTLDGMAEAIYVAGTASGSVSVRAQAGSAQKTVLLSLTRLAVGGLSLSAGSGTVLADGYASTLLSATVRDVLGNPVAAGTVVEFTASLGALEDVQPTDGNGVATAKLRANRFVTGTARVTARAGDFQQTVDVKFVSEGAAQIVVQNVNEPRIGVRSSGDLETAQITFEVRDRNGIPVDADHPATLTFLVSPVVSAVDATVSPATVVTNERGIAVANVQAGTKSGSVELRAASGSLVSRPIRVVIHGDLPDPAHFSIAFDRLNVAGLVYDGIRNPVTAHVGDQWGNPVPDSTTVWFYAQYGLIQGSGYVDDHGEATVDEITAGPRPAIPGGDGLVRVTAQTISKAGDRIETSGNVMWSGPTIVEFTDPTPGAGFDIANGGFKTFTFRVRDANNNPLTAGTRITVSSTAGELGGDTDIELPDTQSAAYTTFKVNLSDEAPDENLARAVTITVQVESQNGNKTAIITGILR